MIRFVFLDLDDTLLDFKKAEALAFERTAKQFGIAFSDEIGALYHRINAAQWAELERGTLTRDALRVRRFEILLETLGSDCDAKEVSRCYESNLGRGHFFLAGAEALLDELFGKYCLYLASNGLTSVQRSRIASADIARYFDAIFLSEQIGHAKPQKAFFDACFASIPDFDPAQAIILGDSLTSDILGGINAGIRTCWFNPNGKAVNGEIFPDYEIRTLDEFPKLLEKL